MRGSALAWLLGFSDPVLGVGWHPRASRAARWRTGRMRALLDLAGAPDRAMRVVLIAGTKGKGSTAAFLAWTLHAAGVRAGLFTSPHLQEYRERVRIDGALLGDADFARAIAALRPIVARLRRAHPDAGEPTTFELTLLLALRAFAARECAVAVVEVGLGGKLDATNALDPEISVITPVSYDHTAILGRTLGAIATEKAGIVRRGRPALVAEQRPAAARAIARVGRGLSAELRTIRPLDARAALGLAGSHQRQNAALAAAAARVLGIGDAAIARGLRATAWPARFERVRGRPPIVLDGAHNGASADALARTLRRERGGRRLVLG
ncbi:MAG TPA: Mur ligase family protein, partial [Candidatus Limnocylindria bacterium]|nr:Mur ligase family protein [Candidatus Limnocylindria bacterium]